MKLFNKLRYFFREIKEIIRYYCVGKENRQIVFYSEDIASYTYFKGIIDELTQKHMKNICYITSDKNDPLLNSNNDRLHCFYLDRLVPFFTAMCEAKLLLMTMPDLNVFHIKRSKFDVNHVYLFHNIGSSFPVIRHGSLFHYDTLFCVGPHHVKEIRRQEELYDLSEKELVEFGYFRLEAAYEQYQGFLQDNEERPSAGKARILIGPSWGENSIFNLCGHELMQILLDLEYEVVALSHRMTNIH